MNYLKIDKQLLFYLFYPITICQICIGIAIFIIVIFVDLNNLVYK